MSAILNNLPDEYSECQPPIKEERKLLEKSNYQVGWAIIMEGENFNSKT